MFKALKVYLNECGKLLITLDVEVSDQTSVFFDGSSIKVEILRNQNYKMSANLQCS